MSHSVPIRLIIESRPACESAVLEFEKGGCVFVGIYMLPDHMLSAYTRKQRFRTTSVKDAMCICSFACKQDDKHAGVQWRGQCR